MPRTPKCRRVSYIPEVNYFKPAGIPLRDLEEVVLSVEEAEALRLKDLEGLEQGQGGEKMNVSRPTFQRVLASARKKIAGALLNGKAIRIEGGHFETTWRRFRCRGGHEWETENPSTAVPELCPTCNTTEIQLVPLAEFGQARRGWGRHNRRR